MVWPRFDPGDPNPPREAPPEPVQGVDAAAPAVIEIEKDLSPPEPAQTLIPRSIFNRSDWRAIGCSLTLFIVLAGACVVMTGPRVDAANSLVVLTVAAAASSFVVVLIVIGNVIADWRRRWHTRRLRRRLAARENVPDDVYKRSFPQLPAPTLLLVRQILAQLHEVEPSKIHPNDRFGQELLEGADWQTALHAVWHRLRSYGKQPHWGHSAFDVGMPANIGELVVAIEGLERKLDRREEILAAFDLVRQTPEHYFDPAGFWANANIPPLDQQVSSGRSCASTGCGGLAALVGILYVVSFERLSGLICCLVFPLALALGCLVSFSANRFGAFLRRRNLAYARRRLSNRDDVSDQALTACFALVDPQLLKQIREDAARLHGVAAVKIHPADEFGAELFASARGWIVNLFVLRMGRTRTRAAERIWPSVYAEIGEPRNLGELAQGIQTVLKILDYYESHPEEAVDASP